MAVHADFTGNTTNTTTNNDLFDNIGSGRVNDLLSGTLSLVDDTEGMLETVYSAFDHLASRISNNKVQVKAYSFPSSEQTPDSRLAFPTVLLAVKVRNHAVLVPYFIVPGRQADFDPVVIRHGTDTISLPRHPSEAYDARALADFKAVVLPDLGIEEANIHYQDVKCIHDVSPFMTDDAAQVLKESNKLINPALRIAVSSLLVTYLGAAKDVSLSKALKGTQGPNGAMVQPTSQLNISYKQLDALRYDEDNMPLGGTMQAVVRVEAMNGDNSTSMNRAQGSYNVGHASLRASIVHASGQGAFNPMFMQPGAPRPPMFTPQLIIDDLFIQGDPTPANIVLLLAATNPLLNAEVLRRMYEPKDIGYLNTRANISGDSKPFAEKDVRANYPQVWQQFFTNSVVVSLCARLGSLSAMYGGMFLRDQLNSLGKGETKAAIESLFDVNIDNLPNSVRTPGVELHAVGTYKAEGGVVRPLSDIDLMWLIRYASNRPQLIDQWAMSSDGSRDPVTSFAMKTNVLRAVTNGTCKITDRALMVSFSPEYLRALALALGKSQVNIVTNLGTLTGIESTRWAPYSMAATALDLNGFVPFTGNNYGMNVGNGGYQYAGYSTLGQPAAVNVVPQGPTVY